MASSNPSIDISSPAVHGGLQRDSLVKALFCSDTIADEIQTPAAMKHTCTLEPAAPSVADLNTSYYLCLTLLNSFCKLDVEFGEILWKTFMLPDNNGDTGGYAGAAVWGSSPSIDIHRNHDFGEAPMMLSIQVEGLKKDIVVAVQKSGFAWAMDRDIGSHVGLFTRLDMVAWRRRKLGSSH
ncbi:hypothetical protein JRO89_XS10G0032800 [Xanthoceras sorbifolium]|uniref:Uncharacterized protein n=1 Tax=Xanthoceras sorbifolium TaxID=99658 RepID=A0ABQ8HHG7_9ROSI|nr:hypothetical protein JRO89_XS10G0032800 [Xanthoceras sorbifolium]